MQRPPLPPGNIPGDLTQLHAPIVLKSGSLSLLETLEPVQASNGITLPFTFYSLLLEAESNLGQ
jgi:hypothetical protein